MLTITHTHAEGTLIDGTSRGDGTAEVLKANGWRWGRSISAWYVPHTRDHLPKLHVIARTREALSAAGFEVTEEIDSTSRPTAEVEAEKAERQAGRVDALEAKAERKSSAEDAAWERERRAVDALPYMGEPIKVGHHSEGRHRNAIAKAHTATRRALDATEDAQRAKARADAATHTTDARYAPVTVANRIDKLTADVRDRERRIAGSSRRIGPYVEVTPPAQGGYRDRLAAELDELRDQLAYWQEVRAHQVKSGQATDYSRDTIKPGQFVLIGRSWHEVRKTNPKTLLVVGYGSSYAVKYPEIKAVRDAVQSE
jgi:hypothetical protein